LARSPPFERWLSQKTALPVAPSPSNAKFLERERYILTLSGADIVSLPRHVRLVPRRGMRRRKLLKRKSRPKAALNSNLMILDQAAINDGFWRPLNMAARAETPVTADKVARVIHRAIKEKPNEIRSQYKKGDP
jgi:hypothetical protein